MKKITIETGLTARFRARKYGANGELNLDTGWFNNHILDNGLSYVCRKYSSGTAIAGVVIGTGNSAPSDSDLALDSYLAKSSTAQGAASYSKNPDDRSVTSVRTFRFGPGVGTGNISEMGMGLADSGANLGSSSELYSRALIRDSGGNPITITKLADETLDVSWEHTIFAPPNDIIGTFIQNIDGVDVDTSYVLRPGNTYQGIEGVTYDPKFAPTIGSGSQTNDGQTLVGRLGIGAVFESLPSTGSTTTAQGVGSFAFLGSYSEGQFYRDMRLQLGLTNGNFSGGSFNAIKFLVGNYVWAMSLSPAIPKTASKLYTLDMRFSVARRA